jgi:CHAD domain-containing protein
MTDVPKANRLEANSGASGAAVESSATAAERRAAGARERRRREPGHRASDPAASPAEAARTERPSAPESTARELDSVRALALRHLDRFVSLEPKVLRNNADAIHDFRVASRRLQQALDLLYPGQRPPETRKLRRKVRRARGLLGEVRNGDVLLERVDATLSRKRLSRRETWQAVREYLEERRAQAFKKARRKLGKVNLAALDIRLQDQLGASQAAPETGAAAQVIAFPERRGAPVIPDRLAQSLERLWREFEARAKACQTDRREVTLHQARIATKRLRYSLEVVRELGVEGSDEALAWLARLQQELGDWHDLDVLEQMMAEMVARPRFLREQLETALAVQKLMLNLRRARRRLEEKYVALIENSADYRRLQAWIARLLSSRREAREQAG